MAAPARDQSRHPPNRRRIDRARQFKAVEGENKVEVSDFDFAAYLLFRGIPFVEGIRLSDREHLFIFQNSEDQIQKCSVDYVNSESARFADALRRIKKVTYSLKYSGRRGDG